MFSSLLAFFSSASDAVLSVIFGDGDAAIEYTLKSGVNAARVTHASIDEDAPTIMVTVVDRTVTITPRSLTKLFVSGELLDKNGDPLPDGALAYAGLETVGPYAPSWGNVVTQQGWWTQWISVGDGWAIAYGSENGYLAEFWGWCSEMAQEGPAILPNDPRLVWSPNELLGGPTGSGTLVCAMGNSASQVLTALNASNPAKALITFALAPGSDGSGEISEHATVTLHT